MKKILLAAAALAAILTPSPARAGAYYGLWWDGAKEQFISLDPYAGTKTVIAEIPGVKFIQLDSYAFDPDSSRYAFIGRETGPAWYYYVINAANGAVAARIPKNDTIRSMTYHPSEQKAFGIYWDITDTTADSAGLFHHVPTGV